MTRFFQLLALCLMLIVAMVSNALALPAVDLTGVTVDTATVGTAAGIVITGLATLWGIRKLIKLFNRS